MNKTTAAAVATHKVLEITHFISNYGQEEINLL